MKNTLLITGLMIIVFGSVAYGETLSYKSTTGKQVEYEETVIFPSNGGYLLKTGSESAGMVCYTDAKYNTLTWENRNEQNGMNIVVKRVENTLEAKGIYKGKPYEKKFKIDGEPWYQDWGLGLKAFVVSDQASAAFWSIEPNQLRVTKFKAVKGELMKIMVNGRETEALYVKVTLTGFAAVFWQAEFWFRPSDGRLLLTKMARGMGVPITTTELVEEK